jgi:Tfp pilus assembly protein PilW
VKRLVGGVHGFTLAELMIGLGASVLMMGALMLGAISLQKSLTQNETYALRHSDQRRLIDYVARDLRRSVGVAATDAAGAPRVASGETIVISDLATIVLSLPGYYRSNISTNPEFDRPYSVVTTSGGPTYGDGAGAALEVSVAFRKVSVPSEGSVCFVREEAGATSIIVRRAEALELRATIAPDGKSCVLEAQFRSPYTQVGRVITTRDQIMLRNLRIDRPG